LQQIELPAVNARLLSRLARLRPEDNFELSDGLNTYARDHGNSGGETREILQDVLECIVVYYRDLAVAAACDSAGLLNAGSAEDLRKRAEGRHPDEFVERAEMVMDIMDAIDSNGNVTLQLDHLFTELGRRHRTG
jgi:hypothetical protein